MVSGISRGLGPAGSGDGLTDSSRHTGAEAEEESEEIKCGGALFSSLKEHALRLGERSQYGGR